MLLFIVCPTMDIVVLMYYSIYFFHWSHEIGVILSPLCKWNTESGSPPCNCGGDAIRPSWLQGMLSSPPRNDFCTSPMRLGAVMDGRAFCLTGLPSLTLSVTLGNWFCCPPGQSTIHFAPRADLHVNTKRKKVPCLPFNWAILWFYRLVWVSNYSGNAKASFIES